MNAPRLGVVLMTATACGTYPDSRARVDVPTDTNFAAVHLVLATNCGTLDCHGAPARNLRVYGQYGLRLFGSDAVGGVGTREEEIRASYESLVAVDPDALHRVLASHGQGAETWVAVSKARGLERHKGGKRLAPGSPGDTCLVSWASGSLQAESCIADAFGPLPRPGESW